MVKCQCYGPLSVFQIYTSPPKLPFIRLLKRPKNTQLTPPGHGSLPHQALKVTHAVTLKKKKKSQQIWKGFHPTQDKFSPALPRTQFQWPGKSVRLDSAHPLDLSSCGGQEGLKLKGQIALSLTSQRSNSCLDK